MLLNKSLELAKVGRSQTSDGIPSLDRGETIGTAARVVAASGDIIEASETLAVQERVEEAKGRLALGQEVVVEQSNDGGESRSSSAGTADSGLTASNDNAEVFGEGGNIRESTAAGVEVALVGVAEGLEVCGDSGILVVGSGEEVGEATSRNRVGSLGASGNSSADRGDPRAGGRDWGYISKRVSNLGGCYLDLQVGTKAMLPSFWWHWVR